MTTRWLLFLAWGILLTALINAGVGFWALKRLEKNAGTTIRGIFLPHLIRPAFTLKNSQVSWRARFRVDSGDLRVQYDPLSVFSGGKLRVRVQGTDLRVHLLGEWAVSQGVSEVRVDSIDADFALPERGAPEIFRFDVNSPELQFNLVEK